MRRLLLAWALVVAASSAAAQVAIQDAAVPIGGDQVYGACDGCHKTYVPTPRGARGE